MAFKHRKLFPSSFISSSDCLVYYCDQTACSPSCSDIYPPIPTPPPPPPRHHAVSPISIALITSLSIFFVFVLYFALLKKDSFRNQGDAVNRRTSRLAQEHQHLDENLTPVYDNPIWLIATVGLPLGVIKSISFFKYKKDDGLIDGTDCSVCLSEFQEDETLRILPKCSHAFHINCIDTWLSTHTNCPLCRAPIVSTDPVSRPATANEETQMRTSDHNGSTVERTEAEHEAEPAAGIDQGNSGVLKECRNSSGKETNSDVGKGEETLSATGLANSDPGTSEGSSGSDKSIRNSWVMK